MNYDATSEMVTVRICYNPLTGKYYTQDQQEIVWETDENGYALLDLDDLPEPDPDKLVLFDQDAPPAKKLPPKADNKKEEGEDEEANEEEEKKI